MTMIETTAVGARIDGAVVRNTALSATGILERIFSAAFRGLVYPQIWEDPLVDMEALALKSTDTMVTIASGSCNVMSYLTANPAEIIAVDLSPAHVALGKLKLAAATHLPGHTASPEPVRRNEILIERAVAAAQALYLPGIQVIAGSGPIGIRYNKISKHRIMLHAK